MEVAAAALATEQAVSTTLEAGVAYGIARPTPAHLATYNRLSSPSFLPRVNHSLTVVRGKGYIFGGETEKERGEEKGEEGGEALELVGDEVQIVTLPVRGKGVGEVDYKCIPSLTDGKDGLKPGPRAGHTAVAIGTRIYLFGGRGADGKPVEENGRVWVFDTEILAWNVVETPTPSAEVPCARFHHGAVGTEMPLPGSKWSFKEEIANLVKTTEATPQPAHPHGTIVIHGGVGAGAGTDASALATSPLRDTWAFDLGTQSWTQLPSLPEAHSPTSTLAFCEQNSTLHTVTHSTAFESSVHSLVLQTSRDEKLLPVPTPDAPSAPASTADAAKVEAAAAVGLESKAEAELKLAPSNKTKGWTTTTLPTNPLTPGPKPRIGAALIPITTGSGRLYLLYLLGQATDEPTTTTNTDSNTNVPHYRSESFLFGLPSPLTTASGIKDSIRSTLSLSTPPQQWEELGVDTSAAGVEGAAAGQGKADQQQQQQEGKAHPGPRAWMSADVLRYNSSSTGNGDTAGVEAGHGVVIWGGRNARGEVEGDGWVVWVGN